MRNSINRGLLIAVIAMGVLGVLLVTGGVGFFAGRRYERQNLLGRPRLMEEGLQGMLQDAQMRQQIGQQYPGLGAAVKGIKQKGITGDVESIEEDGNFRVNDLVKGGVWNIIVNDETVYRDGAKTAKKEDLSDDDRVLVIGEKDFEKLTVAADEVLILKGPDSN